MLRPEVVQATRALLARGMLQRAIWRKLSPAISRGSIHNIARGKHARRRIEPGEAVLPVNGRCPTCGALLSSASGECLACTLDNRRGTPEQLLESVAGLLGEPLGLDLRPNDWARYQEVRILSAADPRARRSAGDLQYYRAGNDRSGRGDGHQKAA
ncbi:MAG: hypothetical protein ACLQNE_35515 [Thermoguttaceae bacterium]